MLFAGGENSSSPFRSEAPSNNCLNSDESPGTKNFGEENEGMELPVRSAGL